MSRQDEILAALARIQEPRQKRGIVELGLVQNLSVSDGGSVSFTLDAATQSEEVRQHLQQAAEQAVSALPWVADVMVMLAAPRQVRENPLQAKSPGLRGVRHILAVSSCKGGVGKSASPPSPSTSPTPSPASAIAWDCSMPTSTGRACRRWCRWTTPSYTSRTT